MKNKNIDNLSGSLPNHTKNLKKTKITFISLMDSVDIPSLRFLSAFIKKSNYKSEIIMLPRTYSEGLSADVSFLYPYSNIVLKQLVEKCAKSDLIGISLMSSHLDNAVLITRYLKKHLSCPIIWGGIHPTIRPLECIKYADMVCIGESEISLSMLMKKMSNGESWKSISIPGIIKQNEPTNHLLPGPILEDLTELPLPDYDSEDQFILYKNNKIIQLNRDLLARCLYNTYRTTFSRGCPYFCTYCCNNALNKVYNRKLPIRHRRIKDIIRELELAKKYFPGLREIDITDDAFFAQSQKRIEEFSAEYKKKINLPFKVLTTPATFTIDKVRALVKAGLSVTAVGIQSASLRTRKDIYKRYDCLKQVLAVGKIISQVAKETKKKIIMRYDLILDNPWETDEDLEDSIRFILKLKRPFDLALFSLTFYPGTELYERACKEGIIKDDLTQVYRKSQLAPARTYLNALIALTGLGMPRFLVNILLNKHIPRKCLVSFLYFLINLYIIKGGLKSAIFKGILKGDFKWFYTLFLFSLDILKRKFIKIKNSKLKRFKGKIGEVKE